MERALNDYTIHSQETINRCLEKLSLPHHLRTLFVVDQQNRVIGSISDGDIRRGLLMGISINESCEKIFNAGFKYISVSDREVPRLDEWKALGISVLPVLDTDNRLSRVLDLNKIKGYLPVSAVIMAGGFGNRLRPLTSNTPKPMLKVGDLPILEINLRRLTEYGITDIHISVNYLKEQIIDYFGNGEQWGCNIHYITEDQPLGTMGALSSLNTQHLKSDVLLFNADILSNIDLAEFYHHYLSSESALSIASIPYKVNIPFAVFELDNTFIKALSEKPTYTYYSNAGFYLFNSSRIKTIPKNTFFNATDFAEDLLKQKQRVSQFPILGYWSDIGSIEDFEKAQEDIKHLDL